MPELYQYRPQNAWLKSHKNLLFKGLKEVDFTGNAKQTYKVAVNIFCTAARALDDRETWIETVSDQAAAEIVGTATSGFGRTIGRKVEELDFVKRT